jgi:hypothetical protein
MKLHKSGHAGAVPHLTAAKAGTGSMKFKQDRVFATPEAAERKLLFISWIHSGRAGTFVPRMHRWNAVLRMAGKIGNGSKNANRARESP